MPVVEMTIVTHTTLSAPHQQSQSPTADTSPAAFWSQSAKRGHHSSSLAKSQSPDYRPNLPQRKSFCIRSGRRFDRATIASCDHFSALGTGAAELSLWSTVLTSTLGDFGTWNFLYTIAWLHLSSAKDDRIPETDDHTVCICSIVFLDAARF